MKLLQWYTGLLPREIAILASTRDMGGNIDFEKYETNRTLSYKGNAQRLYEGCSPAQQRAYHEVSSSFSLLSFLFMLIIHFASSYCYKC